MKDHYSFLAPVYNQLSKLVFGNQLLHAKNHFATQLSEKKILIIGGGDGLDYQHLQSQLSGEYWEISEAMHNKAKVNLADSGLTFHLDFFVAKEGKLFDEVWLHFVLDTMHDNEMKLLLNEIRKSVLPHATIYLADFFEPKNTYQRILHESMLLFFRFFTSHKRVEVPDYEGVLRSENWNKHAEKIFMKGWVKAQLWKSISDAD